VGRIENNGAIGLIPFVTGSWKPRMNKWTKLSNKDHEIWNGSVGEGTHDDMKHRAATSGSILCLDHDALPVQFKPLVGSVSRYTWLCFFRNVFFENNIPSFTKEKKCRILIKKNLPFVNNIFFKRYIHTKISYILLHYL